MSFLKYHDTYGTLDFFPLLLTGVARVYVNTQPAASANGAGYLAQDWGERAGIGSHKGDRFIVGAVDEVYIYTSALTQTQIRHLACVCEDSKGISKFPSYFSLTGSFSLLNKK